MKFFHMVLTAGLLISTALLAEAKNLVSDPYSGTHFNIPEGYVMDDDWTDTDPWGSEYMFVHENGSSIEVEINPISDFEDEEFYMSEMNINMEINMRLHTENFEKEGRTGKCIEVYVNDEVMMRSFTFKDDAYRYDFNFIRMPDDGDEFGLYFSVPNGELEDFPVIIDEVINSIQFDN
ncbi:MAG: hypothetical protein K940chlam2_01303 [Chlamydiae bacterium]|nr:hypothetical protein [Chlamydiota bacterium]